MLESTEQFKVTGQLRQHRSGSHGQGAAPAPAAVTWRLDMIPRRIIWVCPLQGTTCNMSHRLREGNGYIIDSKFVAAMGQGICDRSQGGSNLMQIYGLNVREIPLQ